MSFRIKAFLLHLFLSIVIALISLYCVFFIWYPGLVAKAVGVTGVYFIMLGVDATLGPLLTLILAKKDKKGLKFDFLVIALLQTSALIYGMYNIIIARPIWIAFDLVRFEVVQADSIYYKNKEQIPEKYVKKSWSGPKFVAVRPPKDAFEKSNRVLNELEDGIAPTMQPHLYMSLDYAWQDIPVIQKRIPELNELNGETLVQETLSSDKYNKMTGWLPLKAYSESKVIILNSDDKEIIDIVDLIPY